MTNNSVDDKQLSTSSAGAAMWWITIPDVIAHSGLQCKGPAVSPARFHFAFTTQKYMPLGAPVIRLIPRRIFDHAHTNLAEILRSPQCFPRITSMFGNRNFTPFGYRESRGGHFHVLSIASSRMLVCPAGNTRTTSIQISPLSIYFDLCYSISALITSVVLCGPS